MAYHIVLIPGDGIGPEVPDAAQRIVDATGVRHRMDRRIWPASRRSMHLAARCRPRRSPPSQSANATLKGPTATPSGTGFRSVNVELRQKLHLYANYRPARSMPGVPSRYQDVDLIVVRENTEGLYSGLEHEVVPGVVESLRVVTEVGLRADRAVRVRNGPPPRPQARHLRSQSQHPQAQRRSVSAHVPARGRVISRHRFRRFHHRRDRDEARPQSHIRST